MMTRGIKSQLEEDVMLHANMRSHKSYASLCVQMPHNDVITIIIMIGYTTINVALRQSLHDGF
jgi:hypothetical protein